MWETWWGLNKEEFLPLRGVFFQGNPGDGYGNRRGPSRNEVRERILPVLLELVSKNRDRDVRNSAALAIGRIGDVREFRFLAKLLTDRERTVVESSILALGLLSTPRAEHLLVQVAKDSTRSARQRGLAVMALGYSGGEFARNSLYQGLGIPSHGGFSQGSRAAQLEALRAMAAGLASRSDLHDRHAPPHANPATPHLLKGIRAGLIKDRTFLPTALAALAKTRDPGALGSVFQALQHRRANVRAGAALALGRILRDPDQAMITTIQRTIRDEGALYPRRMLLISLGRISGEGARRILHDEIRHKDRQHRAFATIGAAIARDTDLIPRFRTQLRSARDASMKGAYAIALAILGDQDAAPILLELLEKDRNPDVRAHIVEALTVLRARTAVPLIEKLLLETRSPNLRGACAQALGLIGPFASARTMVQLLSGKRLTTTALGAIATGLGRMGDHRLTDPLVAFVQDDQQQDEARAFAATALGILGEKKPGLPPFARVAIDSHYELRVDVLDFLRHLL